MSIKVVEGQLKFWKFASEFSSISNSMASEAFREYVKIVEAQQKVAPDVIPKRLESNTPLEQSSGKIFSDKT
ncbi:hypothetical protein [Desulfovibrio inopinatus]|uniref:hypothetical protein n=1 Tax=Desulfovibrio inopinatus TaxID=102109 RepID=UPI00040B5893|nr:hypothetical protein [Desulfovibrio inopinatus]